MRMRGGGIVSRMRGVMVVGVVDRASRRIGSWVCLVEKGDRDLCANLC